MEESRRIRPALGTSRSPVLTASAKAFTKGLLHACEPYDANPDEAIMLGFRRGISVQD